MMILLLADLSLPDPARLAQERRRRAVPASSFEPLRSVLRTDRSEPRDRLRAQCKAVIPAAIIAERRLPR